jgi:4-amino-4-deoxy-L-arabinose transferase-like glycosyltransferase
VIALVSIVPGYLLMSLISKKLSDTEKLAASFGISFLIFAGLGLLFHVVGIPLIYTLFAAAPIAGLAVLKRKSVKFNVSKTLLIVLLVAFALRFGLQFFFPVPVVGDSYFHMDMARTFTTDDWFEVNAIDNLWSGVKFPFPEEYRPPFFNFVMGYFYNIFESDFYTAKMLNVFIGVMLVLPTYLIAKKYGSEKIAIIASLFVAVNPLIVGQSLEAEVRLFAAYLALMSFYFFVKGKDFWKYSGAFLGMLYIAHYAPATILALTYAAYLIFFHRKQILTRQTLALAVIFLLIVSPWLARNYAVFGDPLYSSSRQVVWMDDFNQIASLDKPEPREFIAGVFESPGQFLYIKATNLLKTIFPTPFRTVQDGLVLDADPTKNQNVMFNPAIAVITIPLFALGSYYFIRGLKRIRKEKDIVIIYILLGIVISTLFWSSRTTFTYNFIFPQLILMMVFGFVLLEKARPNYKKILYVAIAISLIAQIPAYQIRADAKTDFGQSWVAENTQPDDIIMVRWTNVNIIDLYADRRAVTMPFEDEDTVISFARENNVSYIVIDQLDLDIKKVGIDSLNSKLELAGVYKVPAQEGAREYTNTYWIFRVQ